MKKASVAISIFFTVFCLMFIAACGGGGGNSESNNGTPGSPVTGNVPAQKPSELRNVSLNFIPSGFEVKFDSSPASEQVSEYVVICSKDGQTHMTKTATTTTIKCDGLFPGVWYNFQVFAKNSAGSGIITDVGSAKVSITMESSTPYIKKMGDLRIAGIEKADGSYLYVLDKNYNILRSGMIFGPQFYLNDVIPRQGTNLVDVFATQCNPGPSEKYPTAQRSQGTVFKVVVDISGIPEIKQSVEIASNQEIINGVHRLDDENFFQFIIFDNSYPQLMKVDMEGNILYHGVPWPGKFRVWAMDVTKDKLYFGAAEMKFGYGGRAKAVIMDRDFQNVQESDLARPFIYGTSGDIIYSIKASSGRILMAADYQVDALGLQSSMLGAIYEISPTTGAVTEIYTTENGIRKFNLDSQGNIYASLLGPSSSFVKLSPDGNLLWTAPLLHPCQTSQILFEEEQGVLFRLFANYNDFSEADYFAQTPLQIFRMTDGK